MKKIPMDKCIKGKIYKLSSRNLSIGVYAGYGEFIGIRSKFGDRFLFIEYHWDMGPPYGTVDPIEEIGQVPENMVLSTNKTIRCSKCKKEIVFIKPEEGDTKEDMGWFYVRDGIPTTKSEHLTEEAMPDRESNKELFEYLNSIK